MERIKQKLYVPAFRVRSGIQSIIADIRGESQNTSNAGGVIVSLLIVALVLGFSTGFLQNTFFPWVQSKFTSLFGT